MSIRRVARYSVLPALFLWLLGPTAYGQADQPAHPSTGPELQMTDHGAVVVRAKESFSNLTLEGSDLKPLPPLPGGRGQNPEFTRELVRLQWRPNDPVDVYLILPAKLKKPPVVLYLYGYASNLDRFKDDRYCQRLVKNGAAAVGFVSAFSDYRIESHPLKEWFVSELAQSLTTTVHDVQLILNYLETRGDLDMCRVGMFGQGSGGAIAMLAASVDHRLKAIDLLNPWGDWPDWLAKSPMIPKEERDKYLEADFLKQVATLDPVKYLPALESSAVRIQFWDDENNATKEAAAKLEAAVPDGAKVLHYPTGHAMYAVASEGRLFEWIATTLKSSAVTAQTAPTATQ